VQQLADPPNLTDWMQAWGNLAGALFSACAFVAAVGLLWHEMRIRRKDEEDRLAAQARMVLVSVLDARGDVDDGTTRMLIVNVRNHSQAPIIDVEVKASRPDGDGADHDYLAFHVEAIEPGESDSDLWLLRSPVRTSRSTPITDQVKSRVDFTDAQGLRWVRTGRDQPQRQL
jgi:hypothetical protein